MNMHHYICDLNTIAAAVIFQVGSATSRSTRCADTSGPGPENGSSQSSRGVTGKRIRRSSRRCWKN